MLILLCVFLFFFSVLVLIRLFYFKKQLKHLSEETEKNKSADYNQPIRIDDYDRDLLNLAVKINDNNEIKRRFHIICDRLEHRDPHVRFHTTRNRKPSVKSIESTVFSKVATLKIQQSGLGNNAAPFADPKIDF